MVGDRLRFSNPCVLAAAEDVGLGKGLKLAGLSVRLLSAALSGSAAAAAR